MNVNVAIGPLVSLIAGILILIVPRLLNYIVAIYLIVIGLLGLFGGNFHPSGAAAWAVPQSESIPQLSPLPDASVARHMQTM